MVEKGLKGSVWYLETSKTVRVKDVQDILGTVSIFSVCQVEEPHFARNDVDSGGEDPGLGWRNSRRAEDRPLSATSEACNTT